MIARLPMFAKGAAFAAAAFALSAGQAFAADTYVFDKEHTEIRFSWSHFGLSRSAANFDGYEGELVYDAAAPEKSTLTVKIDPASVRTRTANFDGHMKGADWFDVKKFPDASFKVTKLEKSSEKAGKMTGDLTLKGITKPVTLDVTLNFAGPHPFNKNPTLGISAKGVVKRSDFDLGKYAPAISDEVLVEIETELLKKQ